MFQISNIGWRKTKPVLEKRVHVLTWPYLVAAIILQKRVKQNLDCRCPSQWSQFSFSPLEFLSAHVGLECGCSAVGIATSYALNDLGFWVRVLVGLIILTSPYRPDRIWAHPASYPMNTVGSFSGGKAADLKLTILLQLVPISRKCGFIHSLPQTAWCNA
jgi:hypothetical protein